MRELRYFIAILLVVASGTLIWMADPARERLQKRLDLCHQATCSVGTPELEYLTVFSKGKCVCLPPEPVMP